MILPFCGFSQNTEEKEMNICILDSTEYNITSKTLAPSTIHLPFKSIAVVDARFDTSKLGFELKRGAGYISNSDFRKIKLQGGTDKAIRDFYNDYYQLCLKDTLNELLIVLKTLWIDNFPTGEFKERRRFDVVRETYQDIYVKVEYYLKRENEYYPLKRADTVYQLTEQIINSKKLNFKKSNLSFFVFTLKSLIETYDFDGLINSIDIRKSLSQKRIDSFNSKRFLLPVLIADSIKKGIFLSVNDFINNTPIADSAYTFDKKGRLFKKGDKTTEIFYLLYANEKGLYFRPSKKAYIFRMGNAFEFFILNDVYLSKTTAGNLLGLIPDTKFPGTEGLERTEFHTGNAARLHYILVPRQINMETGELY
ncbi:MAG: hypothetical protein IPP96_13480 [Chitinophagaceae bacterium]|nr:hypothetical protein [Chitinophagaceae bacterium]